MAQTLHYIFTHSILRDIALDEPDYITQVFQSGPQNMLGYLNFLRDKIKENHPDLENADGDFSFEISLSVINENTKLLNIIMPKPTSHSEAEVIGLCFGEKVRYFTMEYGINPVTHVAYHSLCEWSNKRSHLNYGMINNPTPGVFAGKVADVINQ